MERNKNEQDLKMEIGAIMKTNTEEIMKMVNFRMQTQTIRAISTNHSRERREKLRH